MIKMPERSELVEQVAKLNCDYHREKTLRHRLASEATREKKRADMLQRKLDSIKATLLSMHQEYEEASKLEGLTVINHIIHLTEVEP